LDKFEERVIYCQCAHFSLGLTAGRTLQEAEAAFAFMLKLSNCSSFCWCLKCTAARENVPQLVVLCSVANSAFFSLKLAFFHSQIAEKMQKQRAAEI